MPRLAFYNYFRGCSGIHPCHSTWAQMALGSCTLSGVTEVMSTISSTPKSWVNILSGKRSAPLPSACRWGTEGQWHPTMQRKFKSISCTRAELTLELTLKETEHRTPVRNPPTCLSFKKLRLGRSRESSQWGHSGVFTETQAPSGGDAEFTGLKLFGIFGGLGMGVRNQTPKKNKIKIIVRPPSWNTEEQQKCTRKKLHRAWVLALGRGKGGQRREQGVQGQLTK